MIILLFIYLFLIILLLFVYIIYPAIVYLLPAIRTEKNQFSIGKTYLIIPAYNEEQVLADKIQNAIETIPGSGSIVIVSDQSTDRTDLIAKSFADKHDNVWFFRSENRGGKNSCINYAVSKLELNVHDILVFTDCNTFFNQNSIEQLFKSLKNGADFVGGSMRYFSMDSDSAKSEGLYWKYEEWIRNNESKLNRLIVANGGICAMWARKFEDIPAFVPNDFEGPLRILGSGGNCVFNEKAVGIEKAIFDEREELLRKKRMATRQMSCISYLWSRLDFITKLQVTIRKTLRWFGVHIFILSSAIPMVSYLVLGEMETLFWIHLFILTFIILSLTPIARIHGIISSIRHAVLVHQYAASGAMKSLMGEKKSIWNKASTNRM